MKSYNFKIKDESIEDIIDFSKFENEKNILVQVFNGQDRISYEKCISLITEKLPQSICIGSTSNSEILEDKIHNASIVISISVFEKTIIKGCFSNEENCLDRGSEIANKLLNEDTKLLLVFSNVKDINEDKFLKAIQIINPKVIVAGGIASSNNYCNSSIVSYGNKTFENAVVAVALDSKDLIVKNDHRLGWSSIGVEHNITKAIENRVYEVNGIKVSEFYKKYLGDDILDSLPKEGVSFPLLIKRNSHLVARTLMRINKDESFQYCGKIKEGDKVKFGFGNPEMILKHPIIPEDKDYSNVESFFIYSCLSRKNFIPDLIHLENSAYSNIANTCGFFTQGEFFHFNKRNELLNQTMTVVALSENTSHENRPTIQAPVKHKSNEYTKTIQKLTHLVEQSSKDYDEQSLKLEMEKINSQMLLTSQKIFLRHAVHETNTPISVIMSNIELFEMEFGKNQYLSTIEVALKNIFNIYDDLSYLVKKDQVVYPKKNIDFIDFIRSRIEFFESSANQIGSKFVFFSDKPSLDINFNESKLQRIIDNNLTNAIKYTEENSNIYITVKKEKLNKEEYVLIISSCSQYIQYPEKVFKEYYREESTKEGFGLGLSLVKRICDEENIGISIESNEYFTSFRYVFNMENL